MSADAWWTVLAGAVMAVGLCGVVIPLLPGLALIWMTAIVHGLIVGFDALGIVVVVVLTALLAISVIKSVLVPKRMAAGSGASGWAQLGGLVGAIIGFFVIPLVGVLVGAVIGVLLAEVVVKGDWGDAWSATKGTAKGLGVSAVIDLGLGMVMIAAWAVRAATIVLG